MDTIVTEALEVPPPEPARPPATRPLDWVHRNLFRSVGDGIVTVAAGAILLYVVYRALRYVFVTGRFRLEAALERLLPLLSPAGFIWVSWPKKASRAHTDITEDVIREVALPLGLVDVKVWAVDATWSGLKLMIRRALR